MEIQHISGNTRCLVGYQMIPLYMTDSTHCIMMDTGLEGMREEIVQTLAAANITPIGLLCTHTHYDHFGNANFFSHRYKCPVALPLGEAEICRTPASVKSHLGVFSAGQVLSDPKMASIPCLVDHVIRPEEHDTMFRGVRFRVLHTPGHSPDHVSYITPDNVCYAGDALLGDHALAVSKLPYAFDFRQSLDSMELFRGLDCDYMILAHKGVVEAPFDRLVDDNRRVMLEQLDRVASLIDHQMTVEEINLLVQQTLGIRVTSPEKALNLDRFLRSYLECIIDDGTHRQSVRNGLLCYEPVDPADR
jgi:glyoxylase-like metal-dependent hydrolase (beta-lactamase superfamily II)